MVRSTWPKAGILACFAAVVMALVLSHEAAANTRADDIHQITTFLEREVKVFDEAGKQIGKILPETLSEGGIPTVTGQHPGRAWLQILYNGKPAYISRMDVILSIDPSAKVICSGQHAKGPLPSDQRQVGTEHIGPVNCPHKRSATMRPR